MADGVSYSSSGYSRFQAILTARPGSGITLPPVTNNVYSGNDWQDWSEQSYAHTNRKRKRDSLLIGPGNMGKALKSAIENEATVAREQALHFHDKQQLMDALQNRFKGSEQVDFHGTCEVMDYGVTHKQRIQTMTHDIWKATGYRFTVKDHPSIKDGHKTRFWCSQDEAHRSKNSRVARLSQPPKPRLSSGGAALAKTRFPCRSRLLISSRDCEKPGVRILTVRIHHEVAHEPYVDASLPPEVTHAIWESFGWLPNTIPGNPGLIDDTRQDSEEAGIKDMTSDETMSDEDGDADSDPDACGHEESPQLGSSPTFNLQNNQNLVHPDIYQQRMRAHISNIRDFCDGLEYQLQFNDYRMLGVLEREGGSFLQLVEDCLKKEGRLAEASTTGPQH